HPRAGRRRRARASVDGTRTLGALSRVARRTWPDGVGDPRRLHALRRPARGRMRIGLVVPGFSADPGDWCIPALRHLVVRLAGAADVQIFALRYPARRGPYDVFGAQVTALGGAAATGGRSAALWQRTGSAVVAEHRRRPFDVLHAFWAGEPGFVAALLGRTLRIPTVVSIAGGELARLRDIGYGGLLRRLERVKTRLALRLAGAVTAGSALALESAQPFLPAHCASRARRVP